MSWIDKELLRRQKAVEASQKTNAALKQGRLSDSIVDLWMRIEGANALLPPELQLAQLSESAFEGGPGDISFQKLLRSQNGAGIGFTGEAIRYFWPKKNVNKSNNFWIRPHDEKGYVISRRLKPKWSGPSYENRQFNEQRIQFILKCLVTGRRVKFGSVRKRVLWIF